MKSAIRILLFICITSLADGQVIKGKVLDQKTKVGIPMATVYFNGTSVGTLTDEQGNFSIDVSKNSSMPLTVSTLGYGTATVSPGIYASANPLTVYLVPKVFEINEIVVKAKPLDREKKYNLVVFKDEFLGTSANAQSCEILNEGDISFNYGSDRDTLKAYASKPLQIVNRKLGYKITYFLDKFEYYKRKKAFVYKGNLIFTEDMAVDNPEKESIERRRRNSYRGSRMHFFRTLWRNDMKSTGFVVYNSMNDFVDYQSMVVEDDRHRKYLSYQKYLGICYYSKIPTSDIFFLKTTVFFDRNGYFDESGITWDGKMSSQRIGDQLPYDYIEQ